MALNAGRLKIFFEGKKSSGQLVPWPENLQALFETCTAVFKAPVKALFLADGSRIGDVRLLESNDTVYAFPSEHFVDPRLRLHETLAPCCCHVETGKSEWVTLNVGGKYFVTTRNTLTKYPTSMLGRMFSEEDHWCSTVDRHGAYLIDRSPEYFEPIINYLRQGVLILNDGVNLKGVLEEAKFFGFSELVEELESMSKKKDECHGGMTRNEFLKILMATPSTSSLRCQGVDLSGADLSHLDLRSINFKYAKMHGANLKGASLEGCQFQMADLSKACLDEALLGGVQMIRTNLECASMMNCKFENSISFANLEGAYMNGANLEGSQMSCVNLRVASLKGAQLKNCVLREAVLAGADLENCNLTGSDLQGANLRGANVVGTVFLDIVTPLHMVHLM